MQDGLGKCRRDILDWLLQLVIAIISGQRMAFKQAISTRKSGGAEGFVEDRSFRKAERRTVNVPARRKYDGQATRCILTTPRRCHTHEGASCCILTDAFLSSTLAT